MQHRRSPLSASADRPLLGLAAAFLLGAITALLGSYWDDAWHTNRGRDEFLIAPHIALYAGVLLAGGALALWAGARVLSGGVGTLRSDPRLALAALGVVATLGSAPIDNAWHAAFGRDAILWSPPHALGIVGLIALSVAMLSLLADPGARWVAAPRALISGLVVGGAVFLVAEYETGVPQLDEAFYLPVLALASALVFELVRMLVGGRWPATVAALSHLALIALASGFLVTIPGWDPPLLPLLIGPALVLDVTARHGWGIASRAAAFVMALYLVYIPYVDDLRGLLEFDSTAIALGPVAAFGAVFALLSLLQRERGHEPQSPTDASAKAAAASALLGVVLALTLAPPAPAHDPGQGEEVGSVRLAARSHGDRASLTAKIRDRELCRRVEAQALAARRAGRTLRRALRQRRCTFEGSIELPDRGRWFLYAELGLEGRTLESWLPIEVGQGSRSAASERRSLYIADESSTGALQILAAVTLYGACLALVLMIARLAAQPSLAGRRGSRSTGI